MPLPPIDSKEKPVLDVTASQNLKIIWRAYQKSQREKIFKGSGTSPYTGKGIYLYPLGIGSGSFQGIFAET